MPAEDDIFAEVPSRTIDELRAAMDRDGFAVLPGRLSTAFLAEARAFVLAELGQAGGEYFCYLGPDRLGRRPLAALGRSAGFRRLFAGLYERAMPRPAPGDGVFQVLRVLAGATGLRHANRFHYDAYLITALVPILIPEGPAAERGNLVLYPNLRRPRGSAWLNLAEKALLQNRLAGRLLASAWLQRRLGAKEVPMEPGNIYLFWGYRSLHANRACPPGRVRATALFHFADLHARNPLLRRIERGHQVAAPFSRAPIG